MILSGSVSITYSMYLMMDHNQTEYVQFLKFLRWFKLHWICCKWRYIVHEQLNELRQEEVVILNMVIRGPTIETNVSSLNDQKIKTNGNELSVDTCTVPMEQ